ncbi:MAG TPA: XVIPCD domain-containing protein [Pseudoxanthomonas sp.]|nr:XVIPCD domain-containing protein [Pseudoxanthomonas sp.]
MNEKAPTPQTPADGAAMPPEHGDFRQASHAGHWDYQRVLEEVHAMEDAHGIEHGPHSERLAAYLLERMQMAGMGLIEPLVLERKTGEVEVKARRDNYEEPAIAPLRVNIHQALARSVEESSALWMQRRLSAQAQPRR